MAAVTGLWLVATAALGRDVPASEPYPHTCGYIVGTPRGEIRLWRRDCAACHDESKTGERE